MTPEEQARAKAINDEIADSVRRRKQQDHEPIKSSPVSLDPTPPNSKAFVYIVIFSLVVGLHLAGFLGYQYYTDVKKQEQEERRAQINAQILAEAQAKAALREAEKLREALRRQQLQARINQSINTPPSNPAPQYVPQPTQVVVQPPEPEQPEPVRKAPEKPKKTLSNRDPATIPLSASYCEDQSAKHAEEYVMGIRFGRHEAKPRLVSIKACVTTAVIDNFRYKTKGQAHVTYPGSTGGDVQTVVHFESEIEGPNIANARFASFREIRDTQIGTRQ